MTGTNGNQPTTPASVVGKFAEQAGGITALAIILGVTRQTLHNWINGATQPDLRAMFTMQRSENETCREFASEIIAVTTGSETN